MAEIARVQSELVFVREKCLPAFLGTPIHEVFGEDYAEVVAERRMATGSLSNWQRAVRRLAELLPLGPLPNDSWEISRADFRAFLVQEPTPAFYIQGARIVWEIGLFVDSTLCSNFCPTFSDLPAAVTNPVRLPEIRRWLMGLPVDSTELSNALCLVLPLVADADPGFAKLALDPKMWHSVILADRDITEQQRTERLKIVEGPWFAHILNNSLLHVLGSIANNHVRAIEDFFDHPNLVGGYTHLMPHYVFAVLFQKVETLRQMSRKGHDIW
jgi:hypothetical protein